MWVNGDRRRSWVLDFGGNLGSGDEDSWTFRNVWSGLTYRPTNAIRLRLNPSFSWDRQELQFVSTEDFAGSPRYLFGSLRQTTFRTTLRLDYTVTPNLTVQFYGAPFLAAGTYDAFKRITDPRAGDYRRRFHTFGSGEIRHDRDAERYEIDEDADGQTDYGFDDPSFNFRDFNSNLVVRWEFQPGSTMFVVWQQARSDFVSDRRFGFHNDLGGLFDVHPHNVFLVKVNKWLSL